METEMNNEELIAAIGVIAEPVRIQILKIIASHGQMCAKDILPAFNITQPTLSHHMAVLEECGVVLVKREGRCVYYSLNKKTFLAINEFFREFMEKPSAVEEDVKPARKSPAKEVAAKDDPVKDKKKKDKSDKGDKKKKDKKKKK